MYYTKILIDVQFINTRSNGRESLSKKTYTYSLNGL
jgi:hypothetical protein